MRRLFLIFSAALALTGAAHAAEEELTLEACYQEALLHNPAIGVAKTDFEQAAGVQLVLQSRALPSAQIGAFGGVQGPRYNQQDVIEKNRPFFLITGSFSQPIFDAAIPASFRRGRIDLALAEQQFNRALLAELYALRTDFYVALQAKGGIAIQESIKTRLQANLQAQEDQCAVGKVSNHEVLQARQQLANIEPNLAASRAAYVQARIDLASRLGRDLGAAHVSAAAPNDPAAGLPVPAGELEPVDIQIDAPAQTAYALAHRPDLLALRSLIEGAREDSRIAHDGYWPRIAFQGNGQLIPEKAIQKSGTVVQTGDESEVTEYFVGPRFTWVPVDGGFLKGQAQVSDAQQQSYEIDLQRLQDDVPRQLAQVAAGLAQATAALQGTERNIDLADRNLRQVEAQVKNGDLPQLDFLNAQSNLLQAQFNRLNALLQNNLVIAQLDVVTGRYLEFVKSPPPAP